MTNRPIAALAAVVTLLAACERGQQLPFDRAQDPVTRTVGDQGATVSTPAGASVAIPAGAVATATQVTLTPTTAPATTASGAAASSNAFRLDPAGLALAKPADVDLSINRGDNAWLASVVVQTPSGTVESGDAGVDLASGVLRGQIGSLGTVQAVIPEAGAILRAQPLGSTPAAERAPSFATTFAPTRSLKGDCGGPGKRCAGLAVEVSRNLLDLVDTAAIVFPRLSGEIRITGATATGALVMDAPVRLRLASRANAATVPVRITAAATAQTVVTETAGRVTLSNVKVTGESGATNASTTYTLTVDYSGAQAWIRLSHSFETTAANGNREPVTVAARIPLLRGE
ncbi:MAG: hypothetical protein JO306_05025 [Gemmatimonadetes bacterium]|nr:hypothetical protein [Gemmatimonadota bacterium]